MINYYELIKALKADGIDEVSITESESENTTISYFNGSVDDNTISSTKSVLVNALINGHMSQYNIENLDIDVNDVEKALKSDALIINSKDVNEIFAGSETYPQVEEKVSDYHEVSIDDKIAVLAKIEKECKAKDPRIVQIPYLRYMESKQSTRLLNSLGLDISKNSEYCALVVGVVAMENGETQMGFNVKVKINFKELNVDEVVNKVVDDAISMLNAKSIESDFYQVIVENDAMKDLFQAFSNAFSGESALKKITPFIGKEGSQIFSEKISIIDDPLSEVALLKEPFDEEGVACYTKDVVKDGKFVGFLHNLKTAKAFNTTSTGNAFNNSVSGANIYIKEGIKTKNQLIESVDKGLLLTGFDGLHAGVNPISGDFSLKSSGYFIENGKIVKPVTLIVATGNFYQMLNEVVEIANDQNLSHEGIGCPSILFKGLSISGN